MEEYKERLLYLLHIRVAAGTKAGEIRNEEAQWRAPFFLSEGVFVKPWCIFLVFFLVSTEDATPMMFSLLLAYAYDTISQSVSHVFHAPKEQKTQPLLVYN